MFFALCPGPFFSVGELFELLMFAASCVSLPVLAVLALVKLADARRARLTEKYSLRLND